MTVRIESDQSWYSPCSSSDRNYLKETNGQVLRIYSEVTLSEICLTWNLSVISMSSFEVSFCLRTFFQKSCPYHYIFALAIFEQMNWHSFDIIVKESNNLSDSADS
jgi:hypothetical protein